MTQQAEVSHGRPQLQASPPDMDPRRALANEVDLSAPDVQLVIAMYTACLAEVAAKGGDTRYAAQNCFEIARQGLGVMIAHGLMSSQTVLANGEPLWRNPAVPPEGQAQRRVTL